MSITAMSIATAATAARIRDAALGPAPSPAQNNTHVWFGMAPGTGAHPLGEVCDSYCYGDSDISFTRTDEDTRRTFLLLVAEAVEA